MTDIAGLPGGTGIIYVLTVLTNKLIGIVNGVKGLDLTNTNVFNYL